jgi:dTDP-4-dehydrorhamnose reductase
MRVAVIGANGQLGGDLLPPLQAAGHEVWALRHADIEITDAARVSAVLQSQPLDLVINAAAYNLVDRAEDEPDVAFSVNAIGPRNLARVCEAQGRRLLHLSTDYVFGAAPDQPGRAWAETDAPQPKGGYAVSKLAGEQFVQAECSRRFVVRTCGLYGLAALRGTGKGNFVETMLRLGRDRKLLRVVHDQHCTPTSTADLANALVQLIATDAFGLYHATNSGSLTWCEFATEIFRRAQLDVHVEPITTAEFGAKAPRPAFSVLDCRKLAAVLGEPLPDWHDALARYLVRRASSV